MVFRQNVELKVGLIKNKIKRMIKVKKETSSRKMENPLFVTSVSPFEFPKKLLEVRAILVKPWSFRRGETAKIFFFQKIL